MEVKLTSPCPSVAGTAEEVSASAMKRAESRANVNTALKSMENDPDYSRQALFSAVKADIDTDDQPEARQSAAQPHPLQSHLTTAKSQFSTSTPMLSTVGLGLLTMIRTTMLSLVSSRMICSHNMARGSSHAG